ncbi:MAG: hypothetical protein IT366_11550 [Candidatus Hydrogenedentes bacterium]|nr:hypothetical protein [Candidatus Hydrogenedentota bacterium]
MAAIGKGPIATAFPMAGAWLTDLNPGDYVLMVEGGENNTYRLGYAVVFKRAADYVEIPRDNVYVPWYVVETVGGAEPYVVVAPVWSFVARLSRAQVVKLRASGWPVSIQGFADALAGA